MLIHKHHLINKYSYTQRKILNSKKGFIVLFIETYYEILTSLFNNVTFLLKTDIVFLFIYDNNFTNFNINVDIEAIRVTVQKNTAAVHMLKAVPLVYEVSDTFNVYCFSPSLLT